jgi:hypothetical protein
MEGNGGSVYRLGMTSISRSCCDGEQAQGSVSAALSSSCSTLFAIINAGVVAATTLVVRTGRAVVITFVHFIFRLLPIWSALRILREYFFPKGSSVITLAPI